jgi:hypothetical protein
MSKKTKTVDLGVVKKGQYGPFFSFDGRIKSITIEREVKVDGEATTERLTVPVNEKGYLGSAYINKTEDKVKFGLDKGWYDSDEADKQLKEAQERNISSFFSIKVES